MNELRFQKLIVDAVRSVGGFAHKMSSKFLIGVPDLFLKLPAHVPGMWEVKINDMPKRTNGVKLDITPLQLKWLSDYAHSGGVAGVISGLRDGTRLLIRAERVLCINRECPVMEVENYAELLRGKREYTICDEIRRAANGG